MKSKFYVLLKDEIDEASSIFAIYIEKVKALKRIRREWKRNNFSLSLHEIKLYD